MKLKFLLIFLFSGLLFFGSAFANNHWDGLVLPDDKPDMPELLNGNLFSANVKIIKDNGATPITDNFSTKDSIQAYFNSFKAEALEQKYGWNNDTSALDAAANLRGVTFTLTSHITNNERQLTFTFTQAEMNDIVVSMTANQSIIQTLAANGITISNDGIITITPTVTQSKYLSSLGINAASDSQDDIWNKLLDFLTGKLGTPNLFKEMAKLWISNTSIDPIAGNPNSFLAQLTKNNFDLAADGVLNGDTSGLNLFNIEPSYSSVNNNGYTVTTAALPLKYTHYFNRDNALIIDMPINYQQIEQAKTYSIALGLGYTHVMIRTNNKLVWALTPSFHTGVAASIDLAAGTLAYDAALASRVTMPLGGLQWGITNDVSYLATGTLKVGEEETPYDLSNVTLLNGIDAVYSFNKNYSMGGYINHFNVASGQEWYIPNYNELGLKFIKKTKYKTASYDSMTASLGYITGDHDYNGFNLIFGFNF